MSKEFDGDRAHANLAFIADPARGGRYTASQGYREAAAFIADRFTSLGFEPAGDDGSYYQKIPMSRRKTWLYQRPA